MQNMSPSSSLDEQLTTSNNEEEELDCLSAMLLISSSFVPMVLRTVIELDLLEIIAKAGKDAQLSSSEIASHLPTKNPNAPIIIEKMLRLLASYSILKCTTLKVTDIEGHAQRLLYGLAPIAKFFVRDEDGISLAPCLMGVQSKNFVDCWYHLKDSTLEGGSPHYWAHGKEVYYEIVDEERDKLFHQALNNLATIIMKRFLEIYNGFESLSQLVDVGGGVGATLKLIVSKYPHIKGINFDMPHVIHNAPTYPGVEHIGGDMFLNVPKGEGIFLKSVLHNWGDDQCLKILKNCYDSLPEDGKVIVVEPVASEFPDTSLVSKQNASSDMFMFLTNPGKERTEKELAALANGAGFAAVKFVCRAYNFWLIEFHKEASQS